MFKLNDTRNRNNSWILAFIFICVSLAPLVQSEEPLSASIHVNWTADEPSGEILNKYLIELDRTPTGSELDDLVVEYSHQSKDETLISLGNATWTDGLESLGGTTYGFTINSSLSYEDQIEISVSLNESEITSRTIVVTRWNQPLADHEVTISTEWQVDQTYDDDNGTQSYVILFDGRGWQQRVGNVLQTHELGNGTFQIIETTDESITNLSLLLSHVWRNETIIEGEIQNNNFEMRGNGTLLQTLYDEESETVLTIIVTDAQANRSFSEGSVSSGFRLMGGGLLNMSSPDSDEGNTTMDGEVSSLYFERMDVDGVRVLSHVEFQATGELIMEDEDTVTNIQLEELTSKEKWVDGVRVEQLNRLEGNGVFNFAEENEENESISIDATIYDFFIESVDGLTTGDRFHLDGTFSGDAQGSFGIVRGIEATAEIANYSDDVFTVNVIHSEEWFNLTGAGGFFIGDNVGTRHNETWDYQAQPIEWENRTIRLRWEETGPEPSSGDEYPENSPIMIDPEAPESEDGLGDFNITRETGLVPEFLMPSDEVSLYCSDEVCMTMVGQSFDIIEKDGHFLPVTRWTGTYINGVSGSASGAVIKGGPLSGLIAEVSRSVGMEFEQMIYVTEDQTLERILSPSVVTIEENHAPSILNIDLREGTILNEGSGEVHVDVEIEDVDWNAIEVTLDLTELGIGIVQMNDLGDNGDLIVHDDTWTTSFSYTGEWFGDLTIAATVTDYFGESDTQNHTIIIENRAPILLGGSFGENNYRGTQVCDNGDVEVSDVNGVSEVAVDLRGFGGELVSLESTTSTNQWTGCFVIPNSVSPGEFFVPMHLKDESGAYTTIDLSIPLNVLNEGPELSNPDLGADGIIPPPLGEIGEEYTLSITASDPDGVQIVQIKLGSLLVGNSGNNWRNMYDDGTHGDLIANDGIWTINFNARYLAPGAVEVTFRGIDMYQDINELDYEVQILDQSTNVNDDAAGTIGEVLGQPAIIIGVILMIFAILIGVTIAIVRKGGGGITGKLGYE